MPQIIHGPAVRELRKARGVSLTDLATRSGISVSHLSNIEKGRRVGSPTAARAIADALGLPLDVVTYTVPEQEGSA